MIKNISLNIFDHFTEKIHPFNHFPEFTWTSGRTMKIINGLIITKILCGDGMNHIFVFIHPKISGTFMMRLISGYMKKMKWKMCSLFILIPLILKNSNMIMPFRM
jgi:hypothetical protein